MSMVNVNIDPSQAPGWLLALLLCGALAAELMDNNGDSADCHPSMAVTPMDCEQLCIGQGAAVASVTWDGCFCQPMTVWR